jgi:3-dehydroquinate dehydratase type I
VTTQVCVSISAPDVHELSGKIQHAERLSANLVEVRLDRLRSHQGLSKIARAAGTPLIATNRPLSEQGSYAGREKDRLGILREAAEEGFDYVDLEDTTASLAKITNALHQKGVKIILSHHDHFRTPNPSGLARVLSQLQKHEPDVCKVVTTAKSSEDSLSILRFLEENHRAKPLVGFAMGRTGVWSRLLAPFHGSAFTYASLARGMETAPGQPTISELRSIYEMLGVD